MALRAVIDHPKFADLKRRLGTTKAHALGYLETLWHFTGRYTPQGNIGKYSDTQIEAWVEWSGEPGGLIAALIETRWIDRDTQCRLFIHDWPVHADQATRKSLKRCGLDFVVACPDTVQTPSGHHPDTVPETVDMSVLPVPVPVPGTGTEPEPGTETARPAGRAFVLPDWVPPDAWSDFVEMRQRNRKAMTLRSKQLTIRELEALRERGQDVRAVLEQSVQRSWQGVFPLSDNGGQNGGFGRPGGQATHGKAERRVEPGVDRYASNREREHRRLP